MKCERCEQRSMAMRSMTSAEKAMLVHRMRELLDEFIDAISDDMRDEIVKRFPRLSARNALLIYMQRPTATDVRRYSVWAADGRLVKHGERALKIFAKDTASLVSVFDVSQTEDTRLA